MATPTTPDSGAAALATPLADEGTRALNFFNGRLLTARDLSLEQSARREADGLLGQAPGPGIVAGLEVRAVDGDATGVVRVAAGLALTRAGVALRLKREHSVRLVPGAEPTAAAPGSGGFAPCGVLSGSAYATSDGVYLLTLAPETLLEGRVPVLAIDAANASCNTDLVVETSQFRLLRLPGVAAVGLADAAVARLRNRVAYRCFGQAAAATAHAQPGQALTDTGTPAHRGVPPGGLLDDMRDLGLRDCDTPLALVYLVAGRVVFVDRWAVRRRVAAHLAAPAWAAWLGPRIDALAEARLAQFQEHLAELPASLRSAPVAAAFADFLPPAGFLQTAPGTAVDWRSFLGTQAPVAEMPLDPGDAPALLAAALAGDPVAVGGPTKLRVYRIGSSGPQLFVRDSRNVHAAEQVWVNGSRLGLPGVADVQTALERLGRGSCLHVVVRADQDPHAVLADLATQPGRDLTLCFEPGRYELKRTLELTGLGRLQVHGHGALLVNPAGTVALRVHDCQAVTLQGLALQSLKTTKSRAADFDTLSGVLSVVDTPEVHLLDLRVQGAAANEPVSAGIVVRLASADRVLRDDVRNNLATGLFPGLRRGAAPDSRLRVQGCEVAGGGGQYGIVAIDVQALQLLDNQVGAAQDDQPLLRAVAIGGSRAARVHIEGNRLQGTREGIAVGGQKGVAPEGDGLHCGRVHLARNAVALTVNLEQDSGPPFGLFVGDADTLLVQCNAVQVSSPLAERLSVVGLHLRGSYGPQVVVRDNHFDGVAIGMGFAPDEQTQPKQFVWAFQWNVGENIGTGMFSYPPRLVERIVDDRNLAVS